VAGLLSESASPELVDEVSGILSEFHPAWQRVIPHVFGEADLVLPRIDVPTLLVYGDKDVRSPVKVGEDLHAKISVLRLEWVWPPVEPFGEV
jgi:pimeloyl-ACP methyl ester carboxylesterase